MTKIPFLVVLFFILNVGLFAQHSPAIDSLLHELETAREDTIKVELLLKLFNPTIVHDLELANDYTQQALELSQKLSFDKGIAAAYQRIGIYWSYKGNINKAKHFYLQAIEVHRRLNHPVIAATLVHNIGLLYQGQGVYDSAEVFINNASKIFLEHSDSLKYGSSLDVLSSIHKEKGNYYLGLSYAIKASRIFHKYGDELREADALLKIADGYIYQKEYNQAIDYYHSAIELFQKHNDKIWENYAWQSIAKVLIALNDLKQADSVIDHSIRLSDSLGSFNSLAEAYDIKGEVLYTQGKFNEALNYFNLAMETNIEADDITFNATGTIAIGRCYPQLGKYDQALKEYMSVLPISLKMDVKENLKTIYQNVYLIHEHNGNLPEALEYHKKYKAIEDTITDREKSRIFADMQTKYDTEGKEREIALKEKEITILEQRSEIQDLLRMRLIVTIIVVLVFAILGFYTLYLRMKKNKLKQAIENQKLTHELDLKKRELTTHTLHIIQKNELLEDLQSKVSELRKQDTGTSYNEITRLINTNRLIDKDWDNFKSVFEQVHPDFFTKLKSKYSSISSNELRMAAMMKMNLNTKEMASILNITPESVKKARYRMRKKLELEPEANVSEYLMNF